MLFKEPKTFFNFRLRHREYVAVLIIFQPLDFMFRALVKIRSAYAVKRQVNALLVSEIKETFWGFIVGNILQKCVIDRRVNIISRSFDYFKLKFFNYVPGFAAIAVTYKQHKEILT